MSRPNPESFLKSLDDDVLTDYDFQEEDIEENEEPEPPQKASESQEKTTPEQNEAKTDQEKNELVSKESVLIAASEEPVRLSKRQICWIAFEGIFGVLIGLGIIFVMMNLHNPVEKRLVQEFQRTIHGKVTYETCEKGRAPFTNSELTLKMLQASTGSQDSEDGFSIQEMDVTLTPFPQIFRNIAMETAEMKGVVFPSLRTLEYQNDWRPSPIAPLFSDEIKNILEKQGESLESIRYLEAVKEKYLPAYKEISGKVKTINEEVSIIQKKLSEFPELQDVQDMTPDSLKSASARNPEILAELERMGDLRKESMEIQKSWMDLNQAVAKELSQMREKIALDGKAFSTILHYSAPTTESLTEYLFKSTLEKRLEESINWGKALAQMAEMVVLPKSARPAKYLKANGVIELFGQEFDFDSKWESKVNTDSEISYDGSLHLDSKRVPEEMLKDAFIVVGYSEKPGVELHKISARIPLIYDSMVLGDHAALPLYAQSQSCILVLDLTLFGDEVRGKMNLEMNQVSFESPQKEAELAEILYSQFEGKTFPKIVVSADISGSRNAPKVEYYCPGVHEILPTWCAALQKIHLHAREEIVSAIFERLKNEETAFNGLLEPFYQEILACSERTDFFRNFQTGPMHEAEVEIVPMDLAHLEVKQLDVTENIPTYNPNLGMEEPAAVQENVSGQVGSQAEPVKPIVKSIPVKKVAEITPIFPLDSEDSEELNDADESTTLDVPQMPEESQTPEEPQVPEESQKPVEPQIPVEPQTPVEAKTPAEPQKPEGTGPISVAPLTDIPDGYGNEMPNVGDPVFYSNQNRSSRDSLDIPQSRKKALPLPMSKSTSNFGS
ncbi:MAG: hypothetical protein IJK97_08740 [Thermoguttaceae bacterium]|nr:hypothetical protein [Thermoguttaceae bacterium]